MTTVCSGDDWSDLAAVVRRLQRVAYVPTVVPLGTYFDVVVTEAGNAGKELLRLMDAHPGGCGPVIAEKDRPWMYWVVPPGTRERWNNIFGVCLSAPWRIPFPPTFHERPEGPYWLRPYRADRRVGPRHLSDALDQVRPVRAPYEALSLLLGAAAVAAANAS